MRRRVSIVLATVGLAVLLASAWLGVRSFTTFDELSYESPANRAALVISKHGRFDVLFLSAWPCDEPGFSHRSYPENNALGGTDYSRRVLGFGGGEQLNGGVFVNVPYWFPAVMGVVPVAMVVRAERRRGRIAGGACAVCGYDLRATPDRCPECGTRATFAGR